MAEGPARAQRFRIQASIRYRRVGGTNWFEGVTENISRSGVLFRADQVLEPKTAVQMTISLPVSLMRDVPGKILCRGTIVRTAPSPGGNLTAIAAVIRSYRFARGNHEA